MTAVRALLPSLETARLRLRPFRDADLERLVEVAGQRSIADTTVSVPHPFTAEHGRAWIARCAAEWNAGVAAHFAVALRETPGRLMGYAAVRSIQREHGEGELSFWLDEAHAGAGYATEATGALLAFAFGPLDLNRVCAHHMVRNAASGRVLARIGFRREGLLRQHVRKWDVYEDVLLSAVLREDWMKERAEAPACSTGTVRTPATLGRQ